MFLRTDYLIDGDITDIDLLQLSNDGIKGIIFDLDSTLVAPRSAELTNEVAAWFERARQMFKLIIVSNNKKLPYVEKVKAIFSVPIIACAKKPRKVSFIKALDYLQLPAEQIVVIGDRPLTDVLGGHRMGMKTALVFPLKTMNEPGWITFFRKLERLVIKT